MDSLIFVSPFDGVWLLDRVDCPVVKLFLAHLGYFGDMQNDPLVDEL